MFTCRKMLLNFYAAIDVRVAALGSLEIKVGAALAKVDEGGLLPFARVDVGSIGRLLTTI